EGSTSRSCSSTSTTPTCSTVAARSRSGRRSVSSPCGASRRISTWWPRRLPPTSCCSARLSPREDDDVRREARVHTRETAGDEVQPRLVEVAEELEQPASREEVQVRGVLLGLAAGEEPEPVLEPEAVRDRADLGAAGPQHAPSL